MARHRTKYAAGVFIWGADGSVLAVSRQRLRKGMTRGGHGGLDWGIPAGRQESRETPVKTAARELFEETGIGVVSLSPLLTVPTEITGRWPFHVFVPTPGTPLTGYLTSSKEGAACWVHMSALLFVHDPAISVAHVNRYILYWGFGVG